MTGCANQCANPLFQNVWRRIRNFGLGGKSRIFVDTLVKFWTKSWIWYLFVSPALTSAAASGMQNSGLQPQKTEDQEVIVYSHLLGNIEEIKCFRWAAFFNGSDLVSALLYGPLPLRQCSTATLVSSQPGRNILSNVYNIILLPKTKLKGVKHVIYE